MRFRNTKDESHRLNQPEVRIGVCMNCIVMQQALTMANSALKGNFQELSIFSLSKPREPRSGLGIVK